MSLLNDILTAELTARGGLGDFWWVVTVKD